MDKMSKTHVPTSFGVFKPVGHVVLAFTTADRRDAMQAALFAVDFQADEVTSFDSEEWLETMNSADANYGVLASFGSELDQVEMHAKLARDGHVFLVVFAPKHDKADVVIRLAEEHHATLAQKYGRLLIENVILDADDSRISPDHLFGPNT
ncbi:hypothetical protein ACUHMQ_17870 [Chitinimonas sp. PSY-7]|uniref:hypothetical protein n=1 Tax=Chitinimonas sp. PSY-7 TaxID=3459088 RepID=UPI00403FDE23